MFKLHSKFKPTGDQPQAIEKLVANLRADVKHQTLLGITGSGKTFTMANVIEKIQKPTLVISHNKTLAAQLYQEFKEFFPENSVHYFVSYYDYYQPEAYMPTTDTYIEKDAKINEVIDGLRHASTASILTRRDVLIVASVSCIYGLGSPEEYEKVALNLKVGDFLDQKILARQLVILQYVRNPIDPRQGHFRTRENTVEIFLPSGEEIVAVEIEKNIIASIKKRKVALDSEFSLLDSIRIFPAKHFVTPENRLKLSIENIKAELKARLAELKKQKKVLEAARLKQRTEFDLEMLASTGYVNGIENYSCQLDFREAGSPPFTLLDYFSYAYGQPKDNSFLTIIDESHASLPQIRGMYFGDKSRKDVLINYGFRLPSARDNRPLTFEEFGQRVGQITYVSATPSDYELKKSAHHVAEQVIRPTGILDPEIEIRKTKNQMKDVVAEVKKRTAKNQRCLVLALTKRLAEDIADYLSEAGLKAEYLHSEVKTFERSEILKKLRTGEYEVLVGINLLREGLDLPEVSFIAILDADKEGFLRNRTTLLQIIGRAARHLEGKVILYADTLTGSIKSAVGETRRRRKIQEEYNRENNITPAKIEKAIQKSLLEEMNKQKETPLPEGPTKEVVKELERQLKKSIKELNFELAAELRDKIKLLKEPDKQL